MIVLVMMHTLQNPTQHHSKFLSPTISHTSKNNGYVLKWHGYMKSIAVDNKHTPTT